MTDASGGELVLLDEDDQMHPVENVSNFNESAYYNFFNHTRPNIGGWVRIGNRPNEGYAEVTVVAYEPDGTVAFMFQRPKIADNKAHDAGGARFEVVKPWKEHHVTYRGKACILKDPLELCDPGKAFKANPMEPVEVDIRWLGLSPGWGGEPRRRNARGEWEPVRSKETDNEYARGHFEQIGRAEGVLVVAGRRYEIAGYGFRDHSWGPRYWQNTGPYQWLTMNFGDHMGMMGLRQELLGGLPVRTYGFVWQKGKGIQKIGTVEVETEYRGTERIHHQIRARLYPEGSREPFEVTGKVLSVAPCRNRRAGWVTRISEAMTEWKLGNQTGYGVSEYLTHLQQGT